MVVPLNITDRVWKGLETHQKNFEGRFNAFEQGHNIETGEHDSLKFISSETKPDAPDAGQLRLFYDKDKPQRLGIVDENDSLTEMKFMSLDSGEKRSVMMTYKPFETVSPRCMAFPLLDGSQGVVTDGRTYGRFASTTKSPSGELEFLFNSNTLKNVQIISMGPSPIETVLENMTVNSSGVFIRFIIPTLSELNKLNFYKIVFLGWE